MNITNKLVGDWMKKYLVIDEKYVNKHFIKKYIDSDVNMLTNPSENLDGFVILLTQSPTLNNFNICYLEKGFQLEYQDNRICFFDIKNLESVYQKIKRDLRFCDKRVLLYLGKFPAFGFDVDGGSILAKQLIDTFKWRCKLDVSFIRKNNEEYFDEVCTSIKYFKYIDAFNNKFVRRMENLETNLMAMGDYESYDKIITAHVSKFFFPINMNKSFWGKTILFPMFCSSSYKRAGEEVPDEYISLENVVINNVNKIITPSEEEKNDLTNDYNISRSKVNVIYRGVSPLINYRKRVLDDDEIKIVSIGSIKKQKNNMQSLKVLHELLLRGIRAKLILVTTIQDQQIYQEMIRYIDENNLKEDVELKVSISQLELSKILETCDVNISTSKWETFGRGIFEGACAGLPTIISNTLEVVKSIVGNNEGFFYANDTGEFVEIINKLIIEKSTYSNASKSLEDILDIVSYNAEKEKLIDCIWGDDND